MLPYKNNVWHFKYIEIRKEPRSRRVDIKDYGEVKLCSDCAEDMLQDLADVCDIADAKKLYCIAILRAAFGDIRNRDLQLQYNTSFLSKMIPGVDLSENTVSSFLMSIGLQSSLITEFMNNRLTRHSTATVIVDGMLKDYNSICSSMSEFSRKEAKKAKMTNGKWLYAFRDPRMAFEQECAYVQSTSSKDSYDAERYQQLKPRFGLVVFQSKSDLDPLVIYMAYLERWEIETMFNMYKNIVDRDTVNIHNDYRLYATEFINFLTVIIAMRVKKRLIKAKLNKKYSQKEIFYYLSKVKKVRIGNDDRWHPATTVSYITDIAKSLCIVD